jgi:glucoamylase
VPRYENDKYFLNDKKFLGNPWIICTLWLAQFYMRTGRNQEADKIIEWVVDHRTESGMLAEQVDPEDGKGVGVSPLVWSHAELLVTLMIRYGD